MHFAYKFFSCAAGIITSVSFFKNRFLLCRICHVLGPSEHYVCKSFRFLFSDDHIIYSLPGQHIVTLPECKCNCLQADVGHGIDNFWITVELLDVLMKCWVCVCRIIPRPQVKLILGLFFTQICVFFWGFLCVWVGGGIQKIKETHAVKKELSFPGNIYIFL